MQQVVICSPQIRKLSPKDKSIKTIDIEGIPVTCALVETPDPQFDAGAEENKYKVLVRKRAFSCNYRDKRLLLDTAIQCNKVKGKKVNLGSVGSDFVADVLQVGSAVKGLKAGDRVIGDGHYPSGVNDYPKGAEYEGYNIGLPTNHASKGVSVFHYKKLMKIPAGMSDEVAASFTVGGITSYSMVRKLNIQDGEKILVTAAKSNTSMFMINALKKLKTEKNIKIYAMSGSARHEKKLKELGVDELLISEPDNPWLFSEKSLNKIKSDKLIFNCVIDPFFDLFFSKIIMYMSFGGRYITCGMQDQYSDLVGMKARSTGQGAALSDAIGILMDRNITFIGNCIGLTSDLDRAVSDHCENNFHVQIDSVFKGNDVAEFFNRTYNVNNRWGKVVYKFPV